jgi:hypothetical protein
MIGLLLQLLLLPVRLAFGVSGFAFKTGYRTGRLLGFRRLVVLGTGIIIGLLVAPVPGRQLRERLQEQFSGAGRPDDAQLADMVRFELTHSPRTWHLPQPEVEVTAGRVVLRGSVTDESGRRELERAATGVRGVIGVDNMLAVSGTAPAT